MANKINFEVGFITNSKGLKELKSELAEIRAMAKDISFSENASEVQAMVKAANDLEYAMNAAFDVDLNTVNVQKFQQILKQSGTDLKQIQQGLATAGTTGQSAFLKATAGLMQFNTAAKQTNKFLDSIATSFANTIKWSAMSSIVNTITGTIQKSYYYVKDLDSALNDIRIVTGKNADEMSRFAESANDAAKALAVTTEDYTQGSLIYYQQGLDDETVKALTDITAKTSNVTGQSMSAVSEELTAVWNGYQVANQAAEEGMQVYEEYVDKMAAVGATTASDLQELSVGMSKVASAASSMGVTFDDLTAQIATIVSVTRQAPESVGTALKTIYARLGDLKVDGVDEFGVKLGEVSAQLKQMGIEVLDQNGNLRDMTPVMAEVAEKWNTWTEAQRQAAAVAMAGKRQYNNLIALFDNWDMYGEALKTSMEAAGTLEEQQEIALDSLSNKMDQLKATAEDLYDSLYDEEDIKSLVEGLTGIVQGLADFSDSIGGLINLLPMLGATGMRVFSNQIASGLSTVIINMQNARREQTMMVDNYNQLQAMFSDSSLFTQKAGMDQNQLNIMKQGVEELKQYYSDMQQYQNIMNQEQKETYNGILNNIAKVGELNLKIAETSRYLESENKGWGLIDQEILKNTKDVSKLIEESNKINIAVEKLEEKLSLGENFKFSEIFEDFDSAKFNTLTKQFQVFQRQSENNKEALQKFINHLKEIGGHADEVAKLTQQMNNLSEGTKEAGKSLRDNLNLQQHIANISNMIGAVGQLATSLHSLKNLTNIWSDTDLETGEKILQTIMNLSFVLPSLISSVQKLSSVFGIESSILQAAASSYSLNTTAKAAGLKISGLINKQKVEEAIVNKALLKGEIEINNVRYASIAEMSKEEIAHVANTVATGAEAAALEKATIAQTAFNTSILANPYIAIGAAIVATIGAIAFAYDKHTKSLKANAEAALKDFQEKEKELDANEALYQSYKQLKQDYDDGVNNKNELQEATEKLCEAYDLEINKLDLLNGRYEKVNAQIAEQRKQQLEEQKNNLTSQLSNQNIDTFTTAQKGRGRKTLTTDEYKVGFNVDNNDWKLSQALQDNLGELYNYNDGFTIQYGNMEQMVEAYHGLKDAQLSYINSTDEEERALSKSYQAMTKWLAQNGPQIEAYEQLKEKIKDTDAELVLTNHDFNNIDSLEEYQQAINDIVKELGPDGLGYSLEEAQEMAKTHASVMNNSTQEFSNQIDVIKKLTEEVGESEEEVNNFINKLSNEEKEILFSGKVEIDDLKTLNNVEKAIKNVQSQIDAQDIGIIVSLREKVTSNKKLTKKEVEEMLGEESKLEQDYDVIMANFDTESQLDQVDILNGMLQNRIELDKEYINNIAKVKKEENDLNEERKKQAEIELEQLQNRKKARFSGKDEANLTAEQKEELKELNDQIAENEASIIAYTKAIENYQEIIKNGLLPEETENKIFDNMIAGIDGVISKADVLKDLVSVVGENWTLATGKVEEFAQSFPEVLRYQENYNTLQDGSIQLTEQGKKILQEQLNIKKQEIIAENKEYQTELQHQADLLYAEAEYYEEQAQNLTDYLEGEKTGREVEAKMQDSLFNYKKDLAEKTGQNEEKLNKFIQENYGLTNVKACKDTEDIFNYWCSVGEAAAAAGQAYDLQSFKPPTFNQGQHASGQTSSYTPKAENQGEFLNLDNIEEITKLRDEMLKKAADARNKADIEISKKIASESATQASINAIDNAASGKGNDKSSKSSKSSQKEHKDDEPDRYWEINKALNEIDRTLKKLDKIKSHVFGKQKIQVLKQEANVIKQQTQLYEKLYEEQKKEAEELRGKLSAGGMTFNAEGEITNYGEALKSALASYNNAVDQFNAGLMDETAFKVAEQNYEKFKKNVDRYDKLFYTEMKDIREKIEDEVQKLRDINLETFEIKLQVKIDKAQLRKDFRNFRKELKKDFTLEYEILPNTKKFKKDFKDDKAQVKAYMKSIKEVENEIDIMMAGGTSKTFASISEAQERLKDLNEDFEEASRTTMQDVEDAWDNYLDLIDQTNDKIDQQLERYDRMNDKLNEYKQMIELIYGEGDQAAVEMKRYYEEAEKVGINQVASIYNVKETQKSLFEQALDESGHSMDDMDEWSEDLTKLYNNWQDAEFNLLKTRNEYNQLIKEDLNYALDTIEKNLDKKLTNGLGIEELSKEWEFAKSWSDKYYDNVEKIYSIQTLSNKIQNSINDQTSVKNAQKLEKLREKELDILRNKEYMTEYDLKKAEAKYDITLKEIALEEARNNKSAMKMRRNSEGNWSYQYVADEDDVRQRQQDLLDSLMNLRDLAEKQKETLGDEELQAIKTFETERDLLRQKYSDGLISKEQFEIKMTDLTKRYYDKDTGVITLIGKQQQQVQDDLAAAGVAVKAICYDMDKSNFESVTDEEKTILENASEAMANGYSEGFETKFNDANDRMKQDCYDMMYNDNQALYPEWEKLSKELGQLWNGDQDGSIRTEVEKANQDIIGECDKYETKLKELETVSGIAAGDISSNMKNIANEVDAINTNLNKLLEKTEAINTQRKAVNKLKKNWTNLAKQIRQASKQLEGYLNKQADINSTLPELDVSNAVSESADEGISTSSENTTTTVDTTIKTTSPTITTTTIDTNKKAIQQHYVKDLGIMYDTTDNFWKIRKISDSGTPGSWYKAFSGVMYPSDKYDTTTMLKIAKVKYKTWLGQPCSYDTGGYTGNWNNNGRLALLHQKELVLNAQDTENFLAATNSLRDLVSLDSSIENSIVEAISTMMLQISSKYGNNMQSASTANNTNNTFNITAEFPNANDVNDIREAILGLPNIASQYISKQRI